ncbi:MAG: PAS domain-containing protein [Massilia sp.]
MSDPRFPTPRPPVADPALLFSNGGAMGQEMLAFDWAGSPVGPVSTWPASLCTAVRIMLQCQLPMYIAWGPQYIQFYNDAYKPILGAKHVGALGAPAQGTWGEIWDVMEPMWREVWRGQAFGFDDFKFTIDRFGYSEERYFNYSYSAVPDDAGVTAGILVTFVDTTDSVLARRRQAFLLETDHVLRELSEPAELIAEACRLLGRQLGMARVGYAEVDDDSGAVRIERDWTDGAAVSLAGRRLQLDVFGPQAENTVKAGEVLRQHDVVADAAAAAFVDAWTAIGVRAALTVPVSKDGRLAGVLFLHLPVAHRWQEEEVQLAQDIAERLWHAVMRARAQHRLRESEDHFRHTVELNPDVQWTTGADGLVDHISSRWEEWTGMHGSRSNWAEAVHPDDIVSLQATWTEAMQTGQPYDVETRIRLRDGSYTWLHVRAAPRRDSEGKIIKWYGTSQNVEAYKTLLEQMEHRERDFRTLAEAMPNQAWIADSAGELIWFNQRVYEYSGAAQGELDGGGWTAMVHPDDLAATMASWQAALAARTPYEVEFRLRRGGGIVYRWFIARALPVFDNATSVLRWIGTNTDVEAQKAAAAALGRLNESLEAEVARRTADRDRMWRLSTDIMLVAEFDSSIVAINPAWQAMLGWTECELIGTAFLDLVHPDDVEATVREAGSLSKGNKTLYFENRYRHRDGSYRWLSWTAVPDADYIHAVARDVTHEREQKAALEQTEMALRQAQKLESIGKLTGGVAHDFNNILQVVSGSMQLLQGHLAGNEAARDRLATAMHAVERGAKLASHLLAFARRQPLQPVVLQPRDVLRDMEELLRRALGETIRIDMAAPDDCWPALLDQHQLENVLLNLAINARDAMPDGGILRIEAANLGLAAACTERDIPCGDYVRFVVADTGTGMSAAVLEQACEPFFTTKKEGEGTGLGLSMAYGFVKQSGGHFRIDSTPGEGATVTMYFPRSHAQAQPATPQPQQSAVGGNEAILVVEDDADVQATVVATLIELGYKVYKADDAQAALGILKSGMHIDLLFTDVVMPGPLRSPELARQAKLLHPDIEVLFTSGYTQDALMHGGRLDADVALISKPYRREQLARKLRHMLGNAQQRQRERLEIEAVGNMQPAPAVTAAAQPSAAGRRVLVVEDVFESQQLLVEMLGVLGHVAEGVGSAESALSAFESGGFEVLLTDYSLPNMNGVQLADKLKAIAPNLQVVFLTGYGGLLSDLPSYPHTVLAKPCNMDKLSSSLG